MKSSLKFISKIPAEIVCALIRFYKVAISPILHCLGGGCRFFPTCSEYTLLCVKHHGAIKGSIMGICRIIRCNPLCKGGLDFPKKEFSIKTLFLQNSIDEFQDFDKKLNL